MEGEGYATLQGGVSVMGIQNKEKTDELKALADATDEQIIKDIKDVIVNGLISDTEDITYSLAVLYNSLDENDREKLLERVLKQTRRINDLYTEGSEGISAVDFMLALIYILDSMNSTLMIDDGWRRLFEHGQKVKSKYAVGKIKNLKEPDREETIKGYN